jgi:hypothetical protein
MLFHGGYVYRVAETVNIDEWNSWEGQLMKGKSWLSRLRWLRGRDFGGIDATYSNPGMHETNGFEVLEFLMFNTSKPYV